ncbi:MAG: hypothetical protein ABL933_17285 [Methyloglobulus sp.]|nr:hypothetical protein [Methyloglobulus sp.]
MLTVFMAGILAAPIRVAEYPGSKIAVLSKIIPFLDKEKMDVLWLGEMFSLTTKT